METTPTFPQYAVFGKRHFKAYLSDKVRCRVDAPATGGHPGIAWEVSEYCPIFDNQPRLVANAESPDYVEVLCTEAEFRAAYEATKEVLEINESKWLTPKPVQLINSEQAAEIVHLLSNPQVGRVLQALVLLQMSKYTHDQAIERIAELCALIERRENAAYEGVGEAFTVKVA